jgi:hypothetical protein
MTSMQKVLGSIDSLWRYPVKSQGTIVNSEQPDVHRTLSNVLKREVTLSTLFDRRAATAEEYWPDIEGLDHRDAVTDFCLTARFSTVPSCIY